MKCVPPRVNKQIFLCTFFWWSWFPHTSGWSQNMFMLRGIGNNMRGCGLKQTRATMQLGDQKWAKGASWTSLQSKLATPTQQATKARHKIHIYNIHKRTITHQTVPRPKTTKSWPNATLPQASVHIKHTTLISKPSAHNALHNMKPHFQYSSSSPHNSQLLTKLYKSQTYSIPWQRCL